MSSPLQYDLRVDRGAVLETPTPWEGIPRNREPKIPGIPDDWVIHRVVTSIAVQVTVRPPARGDVVVRWLELTAEVLEPLADDLPREALVGFASRWGAPRVGRGNWFVALNGSSWRGLLDSASETVGDGGWGVRLKQVTPAQDQIEDLTARFVFVSGGFVELRATVSLGAQVSTRVMRDVEERLRQLAQVAVEEFDVCYGSVGGGLFVGGATTLESALPRSPGRGRAECDTVLRGYDWGTFINSALMARLGSPASLAGFEVTSSESGAWVFATPHPAQWETDDEAVAKLATALAPILPAERPVRSEYADDHPRLLFGDPGGG